MEREDQGGKTPAPNLKIFSIFGKVIQAHLDNGRLFVYKVPMKYAGRYFIAYCTIASAIHHN